MNKRSGADNVRRLLFLSSGKDLKHAVEIDKLAFDKTLSIAANFAGRRSNLTP